MLPLWGQRIPAGLSAPHSCFRHAWVSFAKGLRAFMGSVGQEGVGWGGEKGIFPKLGGKKAVSEVGFEPTPPCGDQKSHGEGSALSLAP